MGGWKGGLFPKDIRGRSLGMVGCSCVEGVESVVEYPKEIVRVWVVLFDLFGDDGGMWEIGWSVGVVSLCPLTLLDANDFRGG